MFHFMDVSRGSEPLLRDLLRQFAHPEGPRANSKKGKKVTLGGIMPGFQMNATAEPYNGPDPMPQQSPTPAGFQMNATAGPRANTMCTAAGTGTCDGLPSAGEGDGLQILTHQTQQSQWTQESVAQVVQEWYEGHVDESQCHMWHESLWTWPTLDPSWTWPTSDASWTWPTESMDAEHDFNIYEQDIHNAVSKFILDSSDDDM